MNPPRSRLTIAGLMRTVAVTAVGAAIASRVLGLRAENFWDDKFDLGLLAVGLFCWFTSGSRVGQPHSGRAERRRRLAFGLISLIAGPLIGLAFAGLGDLIGGLEPIDRPPHYASIVLIRVPPRLVLKYAVSPE